MIQAENSSIVRGYLRECGRAIGICLWPDIDRVFFKGTPFPQASQPSGAAAFPQLGER
jgi:hypothetical protein